MSNEEIEKLNYCKRECPQGSAYYKKLLEECESCFDMVSDYYDYLHHCKDCIYSLVKEQ